MTPDRLTTVFGMLAAGAGSVSAAAFKSGHTEIAFYAGLVAAFALGALGYFTNKGVAK